MADLRPFPTPDSYDLSFSFLSDVLPYTSPAITACQEKNACYIFNSYSPAIGKWLSTKATQTVETLLRYTTQAVKSGNDAYFATGAYDYTYKDRKSVHCLAKKCFYVDIDCGDGKPYPTQIEGAKALISFFNTTQLRPSWVINSGNGLHAYWTMSEALPYSLWRNMALYFKQLVKEQGLQADMVCIADGARVLRIPGSYNFKHGEAKLVTVLQRTGLVWDVLKFGAALKNLVKGPIEVRPSVPTERPVDQMMAMFGMGNGGHREHKAKPILFGCAQLVSCGCGPEPQWFSGLQLLRLCEDGREYAHKISSVDPRYDAAQTDAKFDSVTPAAVTCKTFQDKSGNSALCLHCPYYKKITSPAELDKLITPGYMAAYIGPNKSISLDVVRGDYKDDTILTAAAPNSGLTPVYNSTVVNYVAPPQKVLDLDAAHPPVAPTLSINKDFSLPTRFDSIAIPFIPTIHHYIDKAGIHYIYKSKNSKPDEPPTDIILSESALEALYVTKNDYGDNQKRKFMFRTVPASPVEAPRRVCLEGDLLGNTSALKVWLINSGLQPPESGFDGAYMDFVNSYLRQLTGSKLNNLVYGVDHLGWCNQMEGECAFEDIDAFALGSCLLTSNGVKPVNVGSNTPEQAIIKDTFSSAGSLKQWKEIPKLYRRLDQPIGMLVMCMGFASPLLQFVNNLEARNCIFNLYSKEGGKGKTHLMHFVASIWGQPKKMFFQQDSSKASRQKRMAVFSSVPVIMDEITNLDEVVLKSLVSEIAEGIEKQKLDVNSNMRKTGSWSTYTFMTSNKSLKASLMADGGLSDASLKRVIECHCDFLKYSPAHSEYIAIHNASDTVQRNYGLAGPAFIQYLLQHLSMLKDIAPYADEFVSNHGFTPDERFIAYPLAVAILAGRWATQLGLLDYDMDYLENWAINQLVPYLRAETKSLVTTSEDILHEYIADNIGKYSAIVRCAKRSLTDPKINSVMPGMPDTFVLSWPKQNALYIRIEQDTDKIYLSYKEFSNYCRRWKESARHILTDLPYCSVRTKRLGSGIPTYEYIGKINCIVLQLTPDQTKKYINKVNQLNAEDSQQSAAT